MPLFERLNRETRNRLTGASVLIVLVTLITFSPVFTAGFTNWDDPVLVTENRLIRSLSAENVSAMFSINSLQEFRHYIPLVLFSFAVEYQIAGLEPALYHTTNIVLHCVSAVLVLWLAFRLTQSVPLALLTALLFAVHPLRVESVAWVTERKDVLSAVGYFSGLLIYLAYLRSPQRKALLLLSGVAFAFSLLSKAMAMSFPVILLLIDVFAGRRLSRPVVVEKIPFFLLAIGFGILALVAHDPTTSSLQQIETGQAAFSFFERVVLASWATFFYASKLVAPVNLSVLYQAPLTSGDVPGIFFAFPFVIVAILTGAFLLRHRVPLVAFGVLWYLVALVPVLQIVPAGVALVADRFTYIPLTGLFLIVALGAVRTHEWFVSRGLSRMLVPSTAAIVVVLLAYAARERTKVWENSLTLWNSVLEASDSPPPMAYVHRALAQAERGRLERALDDYTLALERDSTLAVAWNNRGNIYARQGRFEMALADYRKALDVYPAYTDATINAARVHMLLRNLPEALALSNKALEIEPGSVLALVQRGQIYDLLGKPEESLRDFTIAIRLQPGFAEAYMRRGDVSFRLGDFRSAIRDYSQAVNLGFASEAVFTNRGSAYANLGMFDAAILDFTRALELNPNYVDAFRNRGLAFMGKGDYASALQHFERLETMGYRQDPRLLDDLRSRIRGR
ncbi:MAG: O-GlcNAc transferase [Bacteroidia bacterium]|nr:MAG: O-GlcNAc transferase [Bacteroidia bacterium]